LTDLWRIILRADFYHLTRVPLEKALPSIAERVLANGERLAIVAGDEKLLTRVDALLWSYKPESFLPHGREGDQPILLTSDPSAANAQNIALIDGQWRDGALGFARAFYFFDSQTIDGARSAWRGLADKGEVERHYWKQDDAGRWVEGP
jgi:DNA polymerase III subunit chi